MPGKKYVRKNGVTYEIMPNGSERKMSKEEASSNRSTNPYLHDEGSMGSKNNNPHRRGSKQSFDWNQKYGNTAPAITTSDNAPTAAMTRNMESVGILDYKNEQYIKEQRRQSSPFKSVYDAGGKVVDSANRLGEQAGDKIQETGEKLRNIGSNIGDKVKKKINK